MHYGATFTKPYGKGKFPAILIVNGWVLEDRNGNMYAHKSYWVLADYLTNNGFAVLRVDSRGMGKTSLGKQRRKLKPGDVAYDLKASLDYLKICPDIDLDRLGLLAQGNGCIPAQIIASKKQENVKFLVQLGAPAISGIQREIAPSLKILKRNKVDTAKIAAYARLKAESLHVLLLADSEAEVNDKIRSAFARWEEQQPTGTISELKRYVYDISGYSIARDLKNAYNSPQWFFNIGYEPERYLEKIRCPMLFVSGDKDTETPADENFKAVKTVADSSKNKNIEVKTLPGLNHLLQTADTGEVSEYITINETMAPSAMKIIADWIKIHTK